MQNLKKTIYLAIITTCSISLIHAHTRTDANYSKSYNKILKTTAQKSNKIAKEIDKSHPDYPQTKTFSVLVNNSLDLHQAPITTQITITSGSCLLQELRDQFQCEIHDIDGICASVNVNGKTRIINFPTFLSAGDFITQLANFEKSTGQKATVTVTLYKK